MARTTIIKGRRRVIGTVDKAGNIKVTRGGPLRPVKSTINSMVKKAISRQAEDKFVGVTSLTTHNSTISSPGECYAMVPAVSQGTGDYQRVGDKIRGKYLYIKGYVQYTESFLNTVGTQGYIPPSTVRVMCLSQKNVKVASAVSANVDVAHLLKDNIGTGTARSFSGSAFDCVAPINKDLFTVHMDKKFKFNWVNHYRAGGSIPTEALASGNDRTKYFTCRIKCPATLMFDDGNLDFPNYFAPFICLGAVSDDGSGAFVAGAPYRLAIQSTLYFEDS